MNGVVGGPLLYITSFCSESNGNVVNGILYTILLVKLVFFPFVCRRSFIAVKTVVAY